MNESIDKDIKRILIVSSDRNLREVLKFCFDGWGYEVIAYDSISSDIMPIKKIAPNVIIIDVHTAKSANLDICRHLKDDFITASIPVITLIDKCQLRSQLLNIKQGVDDYLIKPPDPLDLRVRAEMAMKRSQYSYSSTPLTGLPAGRIIEETLKEKLKGGGHFSFGYIDIDNFKYFNDSYGYLKGDRAIMQTAYMLYTVIAGYGNPGDFIGHIGGDDFVFITTPDKYKAICHNFIRSFDSIMPFHYSPQDRGRGFIIARDRTHKIKEIPLMSVSIAVVNKVEGPDIKNVIEINERVAEVKRYLKAFPGSKFMADRRDGHKDDPRKPRMYTTKESTDRSYRPLGQMLLDKALISREKLDDALNLHWRRGIMLGEVLQQMGLVEEKELAKAITEDIRQERHAR